MDYKSPNLPRAPINSVHGQPRLITRSLDHSITGTRLPLARGKQHVRQRVHGAACRLQSNRSPTLRREGPHSPKTTRTKAALHTCRSKAGFNQNTSRRRSTWHYAAATYSRPARAIARSRNPANQITEGCIQQTMTPGIRQIPTHLLTTTTPGVRLNTQRSTH